MTSPLSMKVGKQSPEETHGRRSLDLFHLYSPISLDRSSILGSLFLGSFTLCHQINQNWDTRLESRPGHRCIPHFTIMRICAASLPWLMFFNRRLVPEAAGGQDHKAHDPREPRPCHVPSPIRLDGTVPITWSVAAEHRAGRLFERQPGREPEIWNTGNTTDKWEGTRQGCLGSPKTNIPLS